MVRLRHVAPAGAPIRATDLARWAALGLSGSDHASALRHMVAHRFGIRHAFFASTGRAGLTLLLKALRRLAAANRDEVILPSYTCFSVAAAVVKAGLRPRIVDISTDTLDFAPDRLRNADFSRVLAIVATNLYGLPNDLPAISAIARERRVFLIDDAAQAMGATVGGRPSGTWGDAGLFSFDKGKNISAIDGGVVVTNSGDVAAALDREMAHLRAPGVVESGVHVAKALVYFALLRPWLYWIPNRIPQLELGKTVFTTEFPLEHPNRTLTSLALTMMRRLNEFTTTRVATASNVLDALLEVPGIRTVTPVTGATPVYLRVPMLFSDTAARTRAVAALNHAGIGATASYPATLADLPELWPYLAQYPGNANGGRYVAQHIVTLPTHAFVGRRDVARMRTAMIDTAKPGAVLAQARTAQSSLP